MKLVKFIKEKFSLPDSFGATEKAETFRNKLILQSRKVVSVTDEKSQELAVIRARDIRTWIAQVEAARAQVTKPLLTAQRRIKSLADDHCAPLRPEQERLEALVAAFQQRERERVESEEEKQLETLRAQLNSGVSLTEAQQDLTVIAPVVKSEGVATKQVIKYVVTDKDALFKARPHLFRVELNLSAVNATCFPGNPKASRDNPDTTSIPGMTIWYELESVIKKW